MNDKDFVELIGKSFDNVTSAPPVCSIIARGQRRRLHRVGGIALALGLPGAVAGILMNTAWRGNTPQVADRGDATTPVISTATSPADGYMRALVGGELRMSSYGCLYAVQGSKTYDVLWPFGYTVRDGANGIVQVFDEQGRPRVEVGHTFQGSGGYLQESRLMRCRVTPPRLPVLVIQVDIRDLSQGRAGNR